MAATVGESKQASRSTSNGNNGERRMNTITTKDGTQPQSPAGIHDVGTRAGGTGTRRA
jgi:hypothetical protein